MKIALRHYNGWDRGLPGGTPATTTIIICTKLCAHRYISRVRSSQVLIFYVPGSGYYHGRSCPICTRCFHRCSARIPTIPSIVVSCYATFLPLPLSPSCFPVRASPGEQKKGEEKPCKPNTSHLHVPFFKRLFLNISEDGFLSIS